MDTVTTQYERMSAAARAFGKGSDARLHGRPLTANPYSARETSDWANWRFGWLHVDSLWGLDVGGRWPVRPLPRVA